MCGVAGFISAGGIPEGEARLRSAVSALHHRGPDGSGIWSDNDAGIGLAHTRLKIIDLTESGAQPMHSADGRYVISYNGEIYNHAALRRELSAAGIPATFRGSSDTETLLVACSTWGVEDAVRRCNGMFAFALWDRQLRTLHLVRDRLGIKPLYWGQVPGGGLFFASEIKGLLALQTVRPELDSDALQEFLHYGFVPAPRSIFRGISKLPPGTILTCRAGAAAELTRYWSLETVVNAPRTAVLPGAADDLDELLRTVVRDHLMADVPVGAFLSGGIDSSLVAAMMQQVGSQPARTFSIGFAEASHDESAHAADVARCLGTEHTELRITPAHALAVIPDLPGMYDEPFADSSQIPTCLLARLTRAQVTVALSGDGGDEAFAGYNRHVYSRTLLHPALRVPRLVRRCTAGLLEAVAPGRWDALARILLPGALRPRQAGDKVHKLAAMLRAPADEVYAQLLANWPEANRYIRGAGIRRTAFGDEATLAALAGMGERLQYLDTAVYLPDDVLTKVDRATMAVALECRVPLLDHRVIEAAWRLPWSLRVRGISGKWLARQILERYVPPRLIARPKSGFSVPLADWLRGGLRDWAESMLDPARLEAVGVLNVPAVRTMWQQHLSGRCNHQHPLWNILTLQAWHEHWRR